MGEPLHGSRHRAVAPRNGYALHAFRHKPAENRVHLLRLFGRDDFGIELAFADHPAELIRAFPPAVGARLTIDKDFAARSQTIYPIDGVRICEQSRNAEKTTAELSVIPIPLMRSPPVEKQ